MNTRLLLLCCGLVGAGTIGWLAYSSGAPRSVEPPSQNSTSAVAPQQESARAVAQNRDLAISGSPDQTVIPGRAIDVEARLRNAAENGDARASFSIYLKLAQCAGSMATGTSEQEREMFRRGGVDPRTLDEATAKLQVECQGAEELIASRGRWLKIAAEKGLKEGQLLYAADPVAVLGSDDLKQLDPEAVAEYGERSERYMSNLAQTGDVDAMLSLSLMYKASQFTPQDYVKSAAFRLAAERVAPTIIRPQPLSLTMSGLDANQQAEAMRMARDIQSRCCRS